MGKDKIIHTNFNKVAHGLKRRENLTLEEMYKGNPFPKTVSYKDIDNAIKLWVRDGDELSLNVKGKKVPTFMMISNQRFSEYSQTWSFTDEVGDILLDFKTITRENNPKQGTGQGGYFNIPGEHTWAMFYDKVMEDNGSEGYNRYSIKQPLSVDLIYNIDIVATHFETINEMNTRIQDTFKSLQHYIRVNGHFMSLILNDISDKSEYNLENRKFFHQQYTIQCLGYIIQEDDFKVERIPHKMRVRFDEGDRKKAVATITSPDETDFEDNRIEININFGIGVKDRTSIRVDEDVWVHDCNIYNIDSFTITRYGDESELDPKKGFTLRKYEKVFIDIKRGYLGEEAIITLHGKNPYFNYYDDLNFIQDKTQDNKKYLYMDNKEEYLDEGRHSQKIVESTIR